MAKIIKIRLVQDADNDSASGKQLAYIESLCVDAYRDEFLQFMGDRSTQDARIHTNTTLWIKCLRNHLK